MPDQRTPRTATSTSSTNGSQPGSGRRAAIVRHPWRAAVVAVALLAAANLIVVMLVTSDTSPPGSEALPDAIQSVSPEPGTITGLRDTITVDLRDDLQGVLLLDRQEIPEDQLDRVEEISVISFRPGPDKALSTLAAGTREVVALYWSKGEARPAQPASFAWTFRVAA